MTNRIRRMGLGVGAALMALGMAAGVYASTQNTNPAAPPFRGPRGGGMMGPMGGPMGGFGPFRMLAGKLGLSDAQKQQIRSILDSHRDEMKAIGDRARTAHQALQAAVTADTIDENTIREKSAAVAAVQADMAVLHAKIHAEVFQVLTPDQQAQAKTLQAEMQSRMQQRMDRMRQRRQPGGGV